MLVPVPVWVVDVLKFLCAVQKQGYVPFDINYGSQGIRGNPVNDTVQIGGMSLVNQTFAGVLQILYGDSTVLLVCRLNASSAVGCASIKWFSSRAGSYIFCPEQTHLS